MAILEGDEYNNSLNGGSERDLLLGDAGNDTLYGNAGNDDLYGDAGNDEIYAGTGDDNLYGGSGDDFMSGDAGADTLYGGSGNDWLVGRSGNDVISGGSGNDRIDWSTGDGFDVVDGGSGTDGFFAFGDTGVDTFVLSTSTNQTVLFENASYWNSGAVLDRIQTINVIGGDTSYNSLTVNDLSSTDVTQVNFWGGTGSDYLNATNGGVTIFADGGAGNDTLYGGYLADALYGGADHDSLFGNGGADTIEGGSGNDSLFGGTGNDSILAGTGDDYISWDWGDGSDTIDGGSGYDTFAMWGSSSNDDFTINAGTSPGQTNILQNIERLDVIGGAGHDSLIVGNTIGSGYTAINFWGDTGNDFLDARNSSTPIYASGGWGQDTLIGGLGDDYLVGNEDNDTLQGCNGNDTLLGGSGSDWLDGYGGSVEYDTLDGGSDYTTDYFVLGDASGAFYLGNGYATIVNWEYQYDYITVNGWASQYSLQFGNFSSGSAAQDTAILCNGDLIGIVADSTNVNIQRDFRFVY